MFRTAENRCGGAVIFPKMLQYGDGIGDQGDGFENRETESEIKKTGSKYDRRIGNKKDRIGMRGDVYEIREIDRVSDGRSNSYAGF